MASSLRAFAAKPTVEVRRCVVARVKPGIHPELKVAKVICNGEEVYDVTGTQETYSVDLWSGNHPFYQGVTSTIVLDEGQVNKFKSRYAGLGSMSNVRTANEDAKARAAVKDAKAAADA